MNDYDNNERRYDENRRPEEIESELERTRAEMSSTIDAIQEKLTPSQMIDQAYAYARNSLPSDLSSTMGKVFRENPVPVTLIGVGLAWLVISKQSSGRVRYRSSMYDNDVSTRSDSLGDMQGDYEIEYDLRDNASGYNTSGTNYSTTGTSDGKLQRAASAISEKGRELKSRAADTAQTVKEKANELKHRFSDGTSTVADKARTARTRVQGTTQTARERAADLTQRSQQQYYRARDNVTQMMEEQPLLIGLLGIAVGTVLGAVLPNTRKEDQLMGRTRDNLLERAKETALAQTETLKESAKRVADVAKEETQRVASETATAVKQQASSVTGRQGTTGTTSTDMSRPNGAGLH